ncbi:TPA: DUF262 domain-containing protein [Streptococcus suis]|nr:DUF262 domain-containing protein [Streptococcus suis]HEO8607561.1 DUF262 domain-containing protein [Streptococcus suis]HEO8609464.1 DUF262 domain-containing protein [Streptococcus suis]
MVETLTINEEQKQSLRNEIKEKSSQIYRDSYQMSIGELINLYRDEELDIHPEFQRVFRWSNFQKTKLIESIMLNIPIPSIFVSQNDEGIWDVIDGVQRLSTIFEFVGEFKNDEGKNVLPLVLEKTDYLPSFKNMSWNDFTKDQQIDFKRSRIDVIIVRKESDPTTKYELFQRLNTGGTQLSGQEVRNCLMIMTSRGFYLTINELAKNEQFSELIPITEQKENEQYKMELLLRALIPYKSNGELSQYTDLAELLDKETIRLAQGEESLDEFKEKFQQIIARLHQLLGEDAFKKFDGQKHKGPFLVSSFQVIVSGALHNFDNFMNMDDDDLVNRIRDLYSKDVYIENTKPGARAIPRLINLTNYGKEYFEK